MIPVNYRAFKFIDRINKNPFISDLNKTNKLTQIKNKSLPFEYLNICFTSSCVNQILIKPITKSDLLLNNEKTSFSFSKAHLDWLSRGSTLVDLTLLSPYEGEICVNKISKGYNDIYNEILILNSNHQEIFKIFNNRNQKNILNLKQGSYFINTSKQFKDNFPLGSILNSDTILFPGKLLKNSGKIIGNSNNTIRFRKGKPILSPTQGVFYVWDGDFINVNSPIMTLLYNKLQTGDIVQGIPKIEHFFEARKNSRVTNAIIQFHMSLKLQYLFNIFKRKLSSDRAVLRSLCKIQKVIIDGILRVYCSQGITISRKHFEIIIKQMTSKVRIIDGGETGLLEGELISFNRIGKIHKNSSYTKIIYEPIILGITQTSLQTESFISSASFQETTKVLTQSAIQGKIDFLNGLKENVILGKLIPGGTGIVTNIITNIYYK